MYMTCVGYYMKKSKTFSVPHILSLYNNHPNGDFTLGSISLPLPCLVLRCLKYFFNNNMTFSTVFSFQYAQLFNLVLKQLSFCRIWEILFSKYGSDDRANPYSLTVI